MTKYDYYKQMESLSLESSRYTSDGLKKTIFGNCATGFGVKAMNIEDVTEEATDSQMAILERFKAETEERRAFWEDDNAEI